MEFARTAALWPSVPCCPTGSHWSCCYTSCDLREYSQSKYNLVSGEIWIFGQILDPLVSHHFFSLSIQIEMRSRNIWLLFFAGMPFGVGLWWMGACGVGCPNVLNSALCTARQFPNPTPRERWCGFCWRSWKAKNVPRVPGQDFFQVCLQVHKALARLSLSPNPSFLSSWFVELRWSVLLKWCCGCNRNISADRMSRLLFDTTLAFGSWTSNRMKIILQPWPSS